MESLVHAYEAYEKRVMRGEFSAPRSKEPVRRYSFREPLGARFGEFLIRTGMRIRCRYAAGKPMAWSPMTGSRQ